MPVVRRDELELVRSRLRRRCRFLLLSLFCFTFSGANCCVRGSLAASPVEPLAPAMCCCCLLSPEDSMADQNALTQPNSAPCVAHTTLHSSWPAVSVAVRGTQDVSTTTASVTLNRNSVSCTARRSHSFRIAETPATTSTSHVNLTQPCHSKIVARPSVVAATQRLFFALHSGFPLRPHVGTYIVCVLVGVRDFCTRDCQVVSPRLLRLTSFAF